MWPWEHAAFAYVLYSLATRLAGRGAPAGDAAAVVVVASLLPDLVDKPLSWTFDVTATGYSLAHSLFVAPLVLAVAVAAAARAGRPSLAAAFAAGYLSHLAGDVLYPALRGGGLAVHAVLWPVVEGPPGASGELVETFLRYFVRFLAELTAADPSGVLLFELALGAFTAGLWAVDGFPVAAECYDALARSSQN